MRQMNGDDCAATATVTDTDRSSMCPNNLSNDRQSKPGAAAVSGTIGV